MQKMNILRKYIKKDKLNIVSFPTHERYQQNLAQTGHNFYLVQGPGIKNWVNEYAPLPQNHILLPDDNIPLCVDPDVILCQNKAAHFNHSIKLAHKYQVPIIHLEHCLPPPNITQEQLSQWRTAKGSINIFISEYGKKAWGWKEDDNTYIIHHGVDTDLFTAPHIVDNEPYILSVCNDMRNRDIYCGFNLWASIINNLPYKLLGDNPGISRPAKNINELIKEYQQSQIFLNTSLLSTYPTVVLEAMACGCAIVSTNNCGLPEILTHNENALLSNDPAKLKKYCQQLLQDKDMRQEFGKKARKTIEEKFCLSIFVDRWNNIFQKLL